MEKQGHAQYGIVTAPPFLFPLPPPPPPRPLTRKGIAGQRKDRKSLSIDYVQSSSIELRSVQQPTRHNATQGVRPSLNLIIFPNVNVN